MDEQKRQKALQILSQIYADARPALHYNTAYELLVAVILSAQCTDERVNKVTAELFKEHNTPQTMLQLTQEELEKCTRARRRISCPPRAILWTSFPDRCLPVFRI